jgi:hypothetical protein
LPEEVGREGEEGENEEVPIVTRIVDRSRQEEIAEYLCPY